MKNNILRVVLVLVIIGVVSVPVSANNINEYNVFFEENFEGSQLINQEDKYPFNISVVKIANQKYRLKIDCLNTRVNPEKIKLVIGNKNNKEDYYESCVSDNFLNTEVEYDLMSGEVYGLTLRYNYEDLNAVSYIVDFIIDEKTQNLIEVMYVDKMEDVLINRSTVYESEPNNTRWQADRIYNDDNVRGFLGQSYDKYDYYKIKFSESGKANFYLGDVPNGCDYDLVVYDNNGNKIASSCNSGSNDELIRKKPVLANEWYYIAVKRYSGTNYNYYLLRSKVYPCTTNRVKWFSKLTPNYNVNRLNKLFFVNAGNDGRMKRTPFEWDDFNFGAPVSPYGSTYNRGLLNKHGCVASAMASILNTKGAKTLSSYYDFRTNTYRVQEADPVSVIWANINFLDSSKFVYNSRFNTYEVRDKLNYPVSIIRSRVAPYFGYQVYREELYKKSDIEKKRKLDKLLSEHPEGVMVRFTQNGLEGESGHTLVFINNRGEKNNKNSSIKINQDILMEKPSGIRLTEEIELASMNKVVSEEDIILSKMMDTRKLITDNYIVSENATTRKDKGDYVVFSSSWCYSKYPSFHNISYIDVLVK